MRLPVILVQNAPPGESAYAEALVGNLIGRAGLDLTLVEPFERIGENSTDRMTLEGITVPSAVLDWQSAEDMFECLARIGMPGTRSPHQLDRCASPVSGASPRRLFLFDLTVHRSAEAIVTELDRIRQSLAVKTVTLGGLPVATPTQAVLEKQPSKSNTSPSAVAQRNPPASLSNAPISASAQGAIEPTQPPVGTLRSDENLDALIDQLDDLDV